jgi:bifunctional dethiobiotin synthetase / adenosylmethionine---8-amino-7-oxononanoate aminotransferase
MRSQVAVGMYRLGPSTASSIIGEFPDIAVYGKMLSGGYMPLAATLATTETFNAFLGKKKWHALLHGHSFTVIQIIKYFISSEKLIAESS